MDTSSTRLHPTVSRLLDVPPSAMEAIPGVAGDRARAMYRMIQADLADPDFPDNRYAPARAAYCLLALRAADPQPKGHTNAVLPYPQP